MSDMSNDTVRLKKEILVRIVKAFLSDSFEDNARLIPFDMRPKGCEVPYRCCIYKERAALRNRVMAGLGTTLEDDDERHTLAEFVRRAVNRKRPDKDVLTVLESACQGCLPNAVFVTELCQGCVARPCVNTCRFNAIKFINGKSVIDQSKCKQCGMCMKVCPYQAIVKRIVPCENVCPVGAIAKGPSGLAKIDFDKCISCGKCVVACPFGAVHEKSQLIDVLVRIKSGMKVVAMMAPSVAGQLPCSPKQLNTALRKMGFYDVWEVAVGADVTAKNEAKDFMERMERGDKFMTTSCCAAYNELVKKHMPEIKPFVSDTHTPLYYTAELVREKYPDAVTVFLSPCVAKRQEATEYDTIDYVLTFEELGAMLIGFNIQVAKCEETDFEQFASKQGRGYPLTGGVAESVRVALGKNSDKVKPFVVDGLNKMSIRDLKRYAKNGACEEGNLIEVMSCPGGCIGGNATLNSIKTASKAVNAYLDKSEDLKLD